MREIKKRVSWGIYLILFLVIYLFPLDCLASEKTVKQQYMDRIKEEEKKQESNREKVEDGISEYIDENTDSESDEQSGGVAFDYGSEEFNMAKAYQVNQLDALLLTAYREKGSFEACITNEVRWKVPYSMENGQCGIATFGKENGSFVWFGESIGDKMEEIPENDDVIAANVQKVISNDIITKIQYTYSELYNMVLVYVKTKKEEYVVPYSENPNAIQSGNNKERIVNGKIYKVAEFIKLMEKIFDEAGMIENGDLSEGLPYRESVLLKTKTLVTIVCIGFIIVWGLWRRGPWSRRITKE